MEEITEAPVEESTVTEEAPQEQAPRMFKVRVNDQELEVDESELVNGYQLSRASRQRFEEAAKMRKEAESLLGEITNNPRKFLLDNKDIGPKLWKEIADLLEEEHQNAQLSPEQREINELKAKLQEQEEAKAKTAQQEEEARLEAEKVQYIEKFEQELISAIEQYPLPRTPDVAALIAHTKMQALHADYDMPIVEAAKEVYGLLQNTSVEAMKSMDPEKLISFLGEDIVSKIRKHDLAQLKGKRPVVAVQSKPAKAKTSRSYPTLDDVFDD